MPTIDTATARRQLADLVSRVRFSKERITLTRYGRACAVLVPLEDLETLLNGRPAARKPKTVLAVAGPQAGTRRKR